jgi:hypothetical protein
LCPVLPAAHGPPAPPAHTSLEGPASCASRSDQCPAHTTVQYIARCT